MTTFSVRVPEDTARRFDAAAAPLGGRSARLRQLIQSDAREMPQGTPPPLRSVRMMVRMSPAAADIVFREAAVMGLRPASWVAALVQRRTTGGPRFSRGDERDLLAIRGEIHRIGINVNQIARALNTAVLEGKVLELELSYLDDLRTELHAHMSTLHAAFAGNLAYWDVA